MVKAVVLGAAGGIGQPLSLLLKLNDAITELALYDIVNSPGVAADLSHINTPAKVTGYLPPNDGLKNALTNAHLIVIPAGVPRKPGMSRDDLFKINAGIVRDLATGIANYSPDAYVLVISNPVNSTVPIIAEVLKKHGVFNAKKVFGVTTLDIVRASTFTSSVSRADPREVRVPVVGGHSGVTIIPLLSQISPPHTFNQEEIESLTKRIQFGGDEVVKAKDGAGSATLSMAQAGARFATSILNATVKGESGIVEPSYVCLDADGVGGKQVRIAVNGLSYFSSNIELGKNERTSTKASHLLQMNLNFNLNIRNDTDKIISSNHPNFGHGFTVNWMNFEINSNTVIKLDYHKSHESYESHVIRHNKFFHAFGTLLRVIFRFYMASNGLNQI
ncbi:malate dehydrogenase, NAD-dependent [Rhizophagus clarus]|uniref:malate dehydrogenase n=1 Tax=Rhizophagus clarus TaxID=94130 RepID=A0A8H3LLK2_9GLOM|nr:malate dehydrogenase, NAD-dependent [Rhizophagus clarus]